MQQYVALLRAINTPPRHVKMERLRTIVRSAGFDNVATYIASGNVIFDAAERPDIAQRLEEALAEELSFEVPVYLRTAEEIIAVAGAQPFGATDGSVEISFLPEAPDPDASERLVATATGADRLAVIGREVYWYHEGPRSGSDHKESTVVRILGMPTTQRSARTIERIATRFLL